MASTHPSSTSALTPTLAHRLPVSRDTLRLMTEPTTDITPPVKPLLPKVPAPPAALFQPPTNRSSFGSGLRKPRQRAETCEHHEQDGVSRTPRTCWELGWCLSQGWEFLHLSTWRTAGSGAFAGALFAALPHPQGSSAWPGCLG